MFKYVGDISKISHYIIDQFLENKNIAIDATLGNGYDTDFLSKKFTKVYSFEIQEEACRNYSERKNKNVIVINNSHHLLKRYITEESVNCIMYNLGFLPGGNKEITTMSETSLSSIIEGLKLLNHGGLMTICLYRGHDEGKEEGNVIIPYLKELPKSKFGVMYHEFLNRSEDAPILIVIERK